MNGASVRNLDIRLILAAIGAIGLAWFALSLVTDDEPSSSDALFDLIDAYVREQMRDSRIPGVAIAIVEAGDVAHARGFGTDGNGNEITPDTPFWIGSNTKSITALATMQLVEAGAIDLDAPAQRYVPEFRVADEAASSTITVRHLLNQTSGISRTDGLKAVVATEEEQTVEEVVADMRDLELNRPVGERFEYANLNSVVLGLIIERVTGESWQQYVQGNIFGPLGMTRTYTSKEEAEANGLTATHRYAFGFPIETGGKHLEGLAPTGYVYSTANDMARYLAMYLADGVLDGNRVLSEAGVAEMLSPATNERAFQLQSLPFTARYGAGWFVGSFGVAEGARWHQGSLPHFMGWMVLLPDSQQAVMVLINAGNQFEIAGANRAWSRIPEGIVNILRGESPPTGTGVKRFFIVFNTLVALALTVQVWSLVRVARRSHEWRGWSVASAVHVVPFTWELGLAALLLVAYPAATGGLGWRATFSFLPDLTLVVATLSVLWLVTGAARAARLIDPVLRSR